MNISEEYDKLQALLRQLENAQKIKENVDSMSDAQAYITIEYRNILVDKPIAVALSDFLITTLRNAAIQQGEELTEKIKNYALLKTAPPPADITVPSDAVGLVLEVS